MIDLLLDAFHDLWTESFIPATIQKEAKLVDLKQIAQRPIVVSSTQDGQFYNGGHRRTVYNLKCYQDRSVGAVCSRASTILIITQRTLWEASSTPEPLGTTSFPKQRHQDIT